jgi:hypothetical protein
MAMAPTKHTTQEKKNHCGIENDLSSGSFKYSGGCPTPMLIGCFIPTPSIHPSIHPSIPIGCFFLCNISCHIRPSQLDVSSYVIFSCLIYVRPDWMFLLMYYFLVSYPSISIGCFLCNISSYPLDVSYYVIFCHIRPSRLDVSSYVIFLRHIRFHPNWMFLM